MKSGHLGLLIALALPTALLLDGCGKAEGLDVIPDTREESCSCAERGSADYGTFRDRAPAGMHWWLPKERPVPFEILGAHDERLISAVPFSPFDEYPILLRVGTRAQRSGDSRTLGYFSERIHNPGDKESQALYGINVYSGSARSSQIGVHGMAQSKPGARQAITTIVGTQGFAAHLDREGGSTHNVIGASGVGQTGKGEKVSGTIHNLIGVQGHSQSRGATDVNQAISVYGRAPEISGSGSVGLAAAGRFDQPAGASDQNHAIIVSGNQEKLSIGFVPASKGKAAGSIAWKERTQSFELSHGLRLPVHTSADRPVAGVPGRVIFNTDHENLNIDTGKGWILPNGKAAK